MTYFGVLIFFILPPILVLLTWIPRDLWSWLSNPRKSVNWQPYGILLAHIILAILYTTPWDNYLVAGGVWWYNPDLVTGITIGWVPIEEYLFFLLQTTMTGLWVLAMHRRANLPQAVQNRPSLRIWSGILVLGLWIASLIIYLSGWQSGVYLSLILGWALIPVLLQVTFGFDILLSNWRSLAWSILIPSVYLWLVDALAIASGTWTIDPWQTTGIKVGPLPIEEMVFFLMTNLIIAFGMTLMLSSESQHRALSWLNKLQSPALLSSRSRSKNKPVGYLLANSDNESGDNSSNPIV